VAKALALVVRRWPHLAGGQRLPGTRPVWRRSTGRSRRRHFAKQPIPDRPTHTTGLLLKWGQATRPPATDW